MIRRPPRSTLDRSSAASDVYKRQGHDPSGAQRRFREPVGGDAALCRVRLCGRKHLAVLPQAAGVRMAWAEEMGCGYGGVGQQRPTTGGYSDVGYALGGYCSCLLYTSDAADERSSVDLGGRRIIKKKNIRSGNMRMHRDNN